VKSLTFVFSAICLLLSASSAISAEAQISMQAASSLKQWNATDEITFGGAIEQVVTKNASGTPPGLNLLMSGSQSVLYVNLGPYLSSSVKQQLATGQTIQVTGIVQSFNGTNYLLARELTLGNEKLEIRNAHGFLAATPPSSGSRSARSQTSPFGGAR
jgi:DNA/RNA endonuclease YhcR with UshA esterase domain